MRKSNDTAVYKAYGIEFFRLHNYSKSFTHDVYFENINSGKERFLEAIPYLATFCRRPYNVTLAMGSLYHEETQKKKRKFAHHL